MSSNTIKIVPYQQKYSWDCGIACVIMVLNDDKRKFLVDNLEAVCEEEKFYKSTWTIDLCYLLKRFGVSFLYTTVTFGVDDSYSQKQFYSSILDQDAKRVRARFDEASSKCIAIEKRQCTSDEIVTHLQNNGPCILLVDSNKLYCDAKHIVLFNLCCKKTISYFTAREYQGHYILLVGFNGKVQYHNPTYKNRLCEISVKDLDASRKSHGTDEDTIFIFT